DIWVVGSAIKDSFDGVSVAKPLIEHWNGSAWTIVRSPHVGAGGNELLAVTARPSGQVWAAGFYIDVTGQIPIERTLVMRWNGAHWRIVATPNAGSGDNTLSAILAATGGVWASGGSAQGTLIEHFVR